MTDPVPIHFFEVDLASQTPKQDDDKNDFLPDRTPLPNSADTPQTTAADVHALLMVVTQGDHESNDVYKHRLKLIRSHNIQHNEDTSSDVANYTQFVRKRSLHHPVVNQLSPVADHDNLTAQLNAINVQRMIRIFGEGGLPPSQNIFENQTVKHTHDDEPESITSNQKLPVPRVVRLHR